MCPPDHDSPAKFTAPVGARPLRHDHLVLMRWIAVGGQSVTVAVLAAAGGNGVWLAPAVAVVAASVGFNLWLSLRGQGPVRDETRTVAHLVFDIAQLTALLALTGGLGNPFALYLLAPITVAAATLPLRPTVLVTGLGLAAACLLGLWHWPLPWPGAPFAVPKLYLFGAWVALVGASLFMALYTWLMAEERRRMTAALHATRAALDEERRVTAVGALAAAVAHEMSTPLATICLAAKEAQADMAADNPLAEDIHLIVSQSERCRDILARLARDPAGESGPGLDRVPLGGLLETAVAPHRDQPGVAIVVTAPPPATEPWVRLSPELVHGLRNLVQNAAQFAASRVELVADWSAESVTLRVRDDGPGFAPHILGRLGQPYLSTRSDDGVHMGLGIFIAQTMLARTEATLSFGNHPQGGAEVVLVWSRKDLEARR